MQKFHLELLIGGQALGGWHMKVDAWLLLKES